MAPLATPGEPREGSRPEPVGNIALVVVFTTCTLSLLYLLWRRASSLRAVVSHQLKTWTTSEGRIRLSEDDGPSAAEFLTDADDEVPGRIDQEDPLSRAADRMGISSTHPASNPTPLAQADTAA